VDVDSLAPEAVEPLLSGRFGRPYLYRESCDSTQELLGADLSEGAAAVCDVQTHGRGRLGRSWETPPARAILCSVLLKPSGQRNIAELSLVTGLAVAEMVEHATGLAVQIKWPNDVMVNRRKVAGVLAEADGPRVVVGMGLNVNQTRAELPSDAMVATGSLLTTDGVRRERAPLLADLLDILERYYERWSKDGLEAHYHSLGARDFLRGRRVYVDGREGVGVGIDRSGKLEVVFDGEHELLESGEVRYER
jgi:BirA family transcriptional regulator, biotin operon repressor / biotin---[acetyl-CoA-carboxylase] ligase